MPGLAARGYLYLGDDARFPYGAKSLAELRECVDRNTRFLLERGAKLIVVACNSAATAGIRTAQGIAAEHGVEVVAVIQPESEIAAAITDSGRWACSRRARRWTAARTCARSPPSTAS